MNSMLTLEEVKSFLEVTQEDVERHLKEGRLHAYKIGGTYLRFRKEEVLHLRTELYQKKNQGNQRVPFFSRLYDFWRFNNFYILSLLLVIALIWIISRL